MLKTGKLELVLPHIQPHEISCTSHNPSKPRTVPFPQKLVPATGDRMYAISLGLWDVLHSDKCCPFIDS